MDQPEGDDRKRKHEELEGRASELSAPPRDLRRDEEKRVKTAKDQICRRDNLPPAKDVALQANFFRVTLIPNKLFMHHMHFEPRTEGEASVSRSIKDGVLMANKESLGQFLYWGELLFLKKDMSSQSFKANVRGVEYTMTLSETIPINTDPGRASGRELTQILSILIKSTLRKQNYKQLRRIVYKLENKIDIPGHDMYAVPGYITSIDMFHGGLMLNVDVSYRFFQRKTVLEMLPPGHTNRPKWQEMLVGATVITNYVDKRGSYNFYTITDVDFSKSPRSTFAWRRRTGHKYEQAQEEMISYLDYYKQQHSIIIRQPDQPLLVSVTKRRASDGQTEEQTIYLIPELCCLAGLTEEMRMDGRLRRTIKEKTSDTAGQRLDGLRGLVRCLLPGKEVRVPRTQGSPGEMIDPGMMLREWGLEVTDAPLQFQGRLLEPNRIFIGKMKERPIRDDATWMNLFGEPPRAGRAPPPQENLEGLFAPVHLESWALVYTRRDENNAKNLLSAFHKVCSELCIKIAEPAKIELNAPTEFQPAMHRAFHESVNRGRAFSIMVAVLPSMSAATYKAAKDIMLHEPVVVQAVKGATLAGGKNIESKCKAILQQIVCKMGGAPWAVRLDFNQPTMIVGIDASHSKKSGQESVVALAATMNKHYTQYFSDIRVLPQGQDMATSLGVSIERALQNFHRNNGIKPHRIIIYRSDPGGRGSLEALMENEIDIIKRTLERTDTPASLCFIVVRKRGLARFFRPTGRGCDNPAPGTVADAGVVSPDYNDFYLVAHHTRSGTVNPTQYQIVYRTEGDPSLDTLAMQKVTFKLCHLYYNYMGTIAEPAPLRYADRLAALMRQTLGARRGPRPELENKLYYL